MGRKATGRSTKLIRVPIRFENQVKELIELLKKQEEQNNFNDEYINAPKIDKQLYSKSKNQAHE